MEYLEPLQRCHKNALVGIVKNLCVNFQDILECYVGEPEENNGELDSENVKTIIQEALIKVRVAEWNHFSPSTMEHLNELLQRCDKNALVDIVKSLCVNFQDVLEYYVEEPQDNNGELEPFINVKSIIQDALIIMQVAEKRQQETDRNAFTVVVGAGVAAGNPDFQMAEAGGRERVSTGLLKVGGDVLSFITTFLSWEKVKLVRELKVHGIGDVSSCHISPCNRMILTSSGGDDLRLWDAASGILKRTFKGHTKLVESCRFFPGGKTIVSSSNDQTLKVWDIASGSLVRTLVGHTSSVMCVDVSPDNERILSASYDKTWKLWNFRTGELQHTEQMDVYSWCCSFSPNGSLLLVGCGNSLRLHDSTTHHLQRTFTGHSDLAGSCSFAPDSVTILSRSNNTMKLWSTSTGQCLRTIDGHSDFVRSCCFISSGYAICSASRDGTLKMWTAATGKLEGPISAGFNKPLFMSVSSDGNFVVSGHSRGLLKMFSVLGVSNGRTE
jgi:hypothetical protein